MKSTVQVAFLAPSAVLLGLLVGSVMGSALAAADGSPAQDANQASTEKVLGQKHAQSHSKRMLPKAPLLPERVPSNPLPPLPQLPPKR